MIQLAGYFLFTLIISLVTVPVVRQFAIRYHVVAQKNHRTVHDGEIPKLGGGAIFFAFVTGMAALLYFDQQSVAQFHRELLSLLIGTTISFMTGALDDKIDLNLLTEIQCRTFGRRARRFHGMAGGNHHSSRALELQAGLFSYPFSMLWIVGVANAFNMIDGLDGLAGGVAVAVSLVSLSIAALFGNQMAPVIAVLLMGAVIGFLRYNLNPASIFMGDSGSLSIGFLLACITLNSASLAPGKTAFIIPLLLLALPITDTMLAITRRLRRGIHPFHADREHIHHRLVKLGLSHSRAALVMVGWCLILGLFAFLVAHDLYAGSLIH
ncbi:MAG: MraY family glycosyltransferase [candidate division KSB1 bacterium]|nr:MraY family glycosyltransferase [candidate division KSB1 bacterium]